MYKYIYYIFLLMSVSDFQCFLYLFPSCFPKTFYFPTYFVIACLLFLFLFLFSFGNLNASSLSAALAVAFSLSLSLSLFLYICCFGCLSFFLVACVPVSVHIVAVNLFLPVLGLSKFAKLARSVTRSRQFSAHLPTLKDPTKQSNLAHVRMQLSP